MKNRNQILILSALLALAAVPFPAMGKTITAGSYREALENPSPGPHRPLWKQKRQKNSPGSHRNKP